MQVSLLFIALAVVLSASAAPTIPRAEQHKGQNHHGQGAQNPGSVNVANNTGSNTNTTSAAGNSTDSGDAQTSLTLDPGVIAPGFANDGQDQPADGQVASLTSTNNFINFCLTRPDLPITNGQQIKTGSCNPAPMGLIPSTDNMPSSKFANPANGAVIQANTTFTITMTLLNLQAGNFVNADENYFAAPQQLNAQGQILGHSHVVIEQLDSLGQTTPTDPNVFAFFKGLNAPTDNNNQLTADVAGGLPPGAYRLASINTAANHQPVLVPIAQHGSLDDAVYFTVTEDGQPPADNSSGAGGNGKGGAQSATSTSDGSAATSTSDSSSATSTSDSSSATDSAQPSATGNAKASGDNGHSGAGGRGGNQDNKGNKKNNDSRGRRRLNRL